MTFTSIEFLKWFLPAALLVGHIPVKRLKEPLLTVVSLGFYFLAGRTYFFLFCFSTFLTLVLGRIMSRTRRGGNLRFAVFSTGILYHLTILAFFKLFPGVWEGFNLEASTGMTLKILLPAGLSFFTLRALSYLLDAYHDKVTRGSIFHDALYLIFFTQILIGPLSRLEDLKGPEGLSEKGDLFADGVGRFMIGYCKKVLIADVLTILTEDVFTTPLDNFTAAFAWLGIVTYAFQLFFDFTGYSDMAIGLTWMFGYRCPENFTYPILADSFSDFWKRWHRTLGGWFRDYIYIPMGGSRTGAFWRTACNIMTVWILTGLWHGVSWNYLLWGLMNGLLVLLERAACLPERTKGRISGFFYRLFVQFMFLVTVLIFRSPTVSYALAYLVKMFTFSSVEVTMTHTLFLLKTNAVFLAAAVLFSFPVVSFLRNALRKVPALAFVFECILTVGAGICFIWALSFLALHQNNPFAYAGF